MSDKKPENDDAIDSLWNQAVADANKNIPGSEAAAIALPGGQSQDAIALPGAPQTQSDGAIALPGAPAHTIDLDAGDPLSVEDMAPPPMEEVNALMAEAQKVNDPRLSSPLSDPSSHAPGSEDAPIALPPPSHLVKDEPIVATPPPAATPPLVTPPVADAVSVQPLDTPAVAPPKAFTPLPSATDVIEKERSIPWVGVLFALAAVGGLLFLLIGRTKETEPQTNPGTVKVVKKIETKTLVDTKAADTKAADTKAADTKAADTKAADTKAADTKVADTKVADAKATDAKAADAKAADAKAAEAKAADAKAAEAKAAEAKAAEAKAAEAKAAEAKAAEGKSSGGTESALIMQLKDEPKVLVSRAFNFAGPDADELSSPFRADIIRALRANERGFGTKEFGAYLKPYLTKLTLGDDADTARCVMRVAVSKNKGAQYVRLSATGSAKSDSTHQKAVADCAKNLIAEFSKSFPR